MFQASEDWIQLNQTELNWCSLFYNFLDLRMKQCLKELERHHSSFWLWENKQTNKQNKTSDKKELDR